MATQMLDAGVPIPIVAAGLCHARVSTTLNVYAHAVLGGDRLAAEALWRRVPEARSLDNPNGRIRSKHRKRRSIGLKGAATQIVRVASENNTSGIAIAGKSPP
jgi:hypothetical protein